MVAFLRRLQLEVQCPACADSYPVSLETVRDCQRLLAEGCPGESSYECPIRYFASLLAPSTIRQLLHALRDLEEGARQHGVRVVWLEAPAANEARPGAPDQPQPEASNPAAADTGRCGLTTPVVPGERPGP